MKNYRLLVTVALVVLIAISFYSMLSGAADEEMAFEALLQEARGYRDQKLWKKASDSYLEVLEMKNEIQYYLEPIDMYYEASLNDPCIAWCEKTLEAFPNNPLGYERMIRSMINLEEFEDAYIYLDEADGRNLTSATLEEYREKIRYSWFFDNTPADELRLLSSGCAAYRKKELWGLCNAKGKVIKSAEYQEISYYANEIVAVLDTEDNWYFMNKSGDYMHNISLNIPGDITNVGLYNQGIFPICVDGKYYYYDLMFQNKFGEYDFAGAFNYGVAAVKNGNQWQIINISGQPITSKTFEDIIMDERGVCCAGERIMVKENGAYIMLDLNGQRVGNNSFDNAAIFAEPYGAICKNGEWGFIDKNCNIIIKPQYEEAKSFGCGLGAVKIGDRWGFVDRNNKIQIEPQFILCTPFTTAGTSYVFFNGDWEVLSLYSMNH